MLFSTERDILNPMSRRCLLYFSILMELYISVDRKSVVQYLCEKIATGTRVVVHLSFSPAASLPRSSSLRFFLVMIGKNNHFFFKKKKSISCFQTPLNAMFSTRISSQPHRDRHQNAIVFVQTLFIKSFLPRSASRRLLTKPPQSAKHRVLRRI